MIPSLPEVVLSKKIIPVARSLTPDSANLLADTLVSAGVNTLEITVESGSGIAAIESLASHPIVVGAGTVTSVEQAEAATTAGTAFLVSPNLDTELLNWTAANAVPYLPGVLTPTEVAMAEKLGAKTVKLFPASIGGPDLVSALRGPFPDIDFIPTGGITSDNVAGYLRAGAVAVGVGGWLTASRSPETVADRTADLLAAIEDV